MKLEFFVPGIAKPAGSKIAQTYRRKDGSLVTRDNGSVVIGTRDASGKAGKDWRKNVTEFARIAMVGRQPFDCPVKLALYFVVPRPKNQFGSGRNAAVVKPSAPGWPAVKPDTTKLTRSVEDALTVAGVWTDDSLVCQQFASKDYAKADEQPGVHVRIEIIGGAA